MRDSSTPRSSVVLSVVVVERGNENRSSGEALEGTSKARYIEKVKDLNMKELACRRELMEILEHKSQYHEDLSSHYCVDWLKRHETRFSRERTLETVDLTGVPRRSIFCPINYRPPKELGSPVMIAGPPKHRTVLARIRVAVAAHLRAVEKLLEPKPLGLPETAYEGPNLAKNSRYGEEYWLPMISQIREPLDW